jgi:hypothetical protein
MRTSFLITAFALFFATLIGCSNDDSRRIEIAPAAKTTDNGQSQNLKLIFKDAVVIDSTNYVMYPLAISNSSSGGSGSLKVYSGSTGSNVYWNIVFYDMAAKTYHLLDNKRKMVITSYNPFSSSSSDEGVMNIDVKDGHIFYSVIVEDYNKDGHLDLEAPAYLFISDKKGNNFKQISPKNVNVFNWNVIKSTGKVLINIAADTNNDKKFDDNDDATPYVYDLKNGSIAQPVLDKNFIDTAASLFTEQWQVKKQN